MHVPSPSVCKPQFFTLIALIEFLLKTRANSSPSQYIASSQQDSPQAISHGFPSVHPVVIPVSLLPTGALPKLFHTVSLPSTLSSLPYRSFPPELSTSYFTWFPFRPPCRQSNIAPSHRTSPQAISHGFPSVHPVVTPVSLLLTGALPKLFPTVSPPVHPVVTPVSLIPTGALPELFHMVSLPSTLLSLPYRSFPPELPPSCFTRFPFRPSRCHSSTIVYGWVITSYTKKLT